MKIISKLFLIASLSLTSFSATETHALETFDVSAYEGKVIAIDFWASWCVPCRRSFPWWNTIQAKYEDEGLVVIGINLDNDIEEAAKFLKEFPAEFLIQYDPDKEIAREFGVQAMPSTYIIGRSGKLAAVHYGFRVQQQEEYEAGLLDVLRAGE